MHYAMPYGRNQGQGQGHSREVDRQSPTGLIFLSPKLTGRFITSIMLFVQMLMFTSVKMKNWLELQNLSSVDM